MSAKKATKNTQKQPAHGGCSASPCSACGQKPRRKVDYGDFSKYEVRCLVAEYCMSVTLGCTGWGVDFKTWVELRGIAKHDGLFRLIRLPNAESIHPHHNHEKQ
jgi:hypothetical protein